MTALLLLAAAQTPQDPAAPKPAALLGTMLSRYADAVRMTGKVQFRQVATAAEGKAELTVSTEFAMERPARLRIVQKSSKNTQKPFVVTSDGNEMTYDVPDFEAPPGLRISTTVADPAGAPNIGRLVAFARRSLPDSNSPFLAVCAAAPWDWQNLKGQWVSLLDGGTGDVNGTTCRIIKGKWREAATQGAIGTFGIWITPSGDLRKYATEQSFEAKDDDGKSLGTLNVLSEWTGEIVINGTIPDGTFTVVR